MQQCSDPNCNHAVTVTIRDERVIQGAPAEVLVIQCQKTIARVEGEVELKPGADGGLYHAVTLKQC